jgi:hypothetical protein
VFAVACAIAAASYVGNTTPARAQVLDEMTNLRSSQPAQGTGGARVGESAYLKLSVVAEAGYDSNLFYNDARKVDSPTLVVTPSAQLTNEARPGQTAPPLRYSLGASLRYREYFDAASGDEAKRAFNPTFLGLLGYSPSPAFSIAVTDQLMRLEEPPYSPESGVIDRWSNGAILDTRITPGGGRLQTTVRYSNTLDYFETDSASFANRLQHELLLGLAWKWLPKTAIFLEGGVGYVQYLDQTAANAQGKANSVPYRVLAGLRGLLTPKLSVNLGVGYADSIYDYNIQGPSGSSNLLARTALIYTPFTLTSFSIGYEHKFVDSPFIGNFYDHDGAAAALSQQVGSFILRAFYSYEYRRYKGVQFMMPVTRRDHLQRAGLVADYYLQRWFFAGLGYSAQINRTKDDNVAGFQAADYTKHVVLGRLGITY